MHSLSSHRTVDAGDVERRDPLAGKHWSVRLATLFPEVFVVPFAAHHCELWEWVAAIQPGVRPDPFVAVWPRGGAKSSSAEVACVELGARGVRRYGLYVCGTQEQADDHVGNVGHLLESPRVAVFYPELSARAVGKFGNIRGWRRNRLSTRAGFVVDALGLDTAVRGVKLDTARPDFIVIDDVDKEHDSPAAVRKRVDTITKALIPAGSADLAVLAIQNLVHQGSVFAQLADDRARFLAKRRVSGPIPAVVGLEVQRRVEGGRVRDVIVAGDATWEGQNLAVCQQQIDDWGLPAFRAEAQHEVTHSEGALWTQGMVDAVRVGSAPELVKVVVAVDPSGGQGEDNDEQGIVVAGSDEHRHGYVLDDRTVKKSPAGWGRAAVMAWREWDADWIVVEKNFGGEMATDTILNAARQLQAEGVIDRLPRVDTVSASDSKRVRAQPIVTMYGDRDREETWGTGSVWHVGPLARLETEMSTWDPDRSKWSPNRLDALVWALTYLFPRVKRRGGLRG